MLNKKERTLELYLKAGAEMRLLKTLGGKAAVDVSGVISAADADKLMKALRMIEDVSFAAENNMFRDHPGIASIYTDVFFGSVNDKPRNDVDRTVIEMARSAADELLKRKNN